MQNFTIDDFWSQKMPAYSHVTHNALKGWYVHPDSLATFIEAPLTLSQNFGTSSDPLTSSILLVSAPGAVGKSTLARQVASKTNAIYIDLAEAEPVGGYSLSGGLLKANVIDAWRTNNVTVLIDGLDEARLKVTQEGFQAFIADIVQITENRKIPTILFGRTGAIQDTWVMLSEYNMDAPVLEIGYYPPEVAINFSQSLLESIKPHDPHLKTRYEAIETLLELLRNETTSDGDRFAGYAPVLRTVTLHVASEGNPSTLISQARRGDRPVTLASIIDAILAREQQKLQNIIFEDPSLPERLYTKTEQLNRLIELIYRVPIAHPLPEMSPKDTQTYSEALKTWVPEHPFLGGGLTAASAVFDAVLSAAALHNHNTSEAGLTKELARGAAANPFLAEFYFGPQSRALPAEHIGVIYASLRARLSLGDTASLTVEGEEHDDELERLRAEVEISIARYGEEQPQLLRYNSDQVGTIRLGSHVEDVEITAPNATIEIGGTKEITLIAPISIQCNHIDLKTERLILESPPESNQEIIFLEANTANTTTITSPPLLNAGVKFSVAWSNSTTYPWTIFSTSPTDVQDPRTDEALRRFRKFIISFRSHSKGSLKRFAAKIEHERMTKGTGRAILDHLIRTGVVSTDGRMYTLHADVLSEMTNASYSSCMSRNFPQKAIEFVTNAIA